MALGMTPGTFAFVYLGEAPATPGPYLALGALSLLAVAAYSYHRRLVRRQNGSYQR